MERIYCDHNATTPMDPAVFAAMAPFYTVEFGNASSIHQFGRAARAGVDRARAQVAALIGASADEIVFTSGGTEADNLAIRGVVSALASKGDHVITSAIEHHAVLNACRVLEKEKRARVTYLPVSRAGVIDTDAVKAAITPQTVLISVMYANNETGVIQPVADIARYAREKGICFHTDAVQAAGKIPLAVEKEEVDLLSLSAHKIYGPKGVGALYIRKGTRITPLLYGGHHERNRRAGTENVAGIVGFGAAAALAESRMSEEYEQLRDLRDRLQRGLEEKIPYVTVNGAQAARLPNTLNIGFEYLEGESIILNLDLEGIAVATGSACTSGSLEPSHVLTAMGVRAQTAQGSVRFSLGKGNTPQEIDRIIAVLPGIVARLRAMSPLYEEEVEQKQHQG